MADLLLMDPDGNLARDIYRRLAEIAGVDDEYRAELARHGIEKVLISNYNHSPGTKSGQKITHYPDG